MSTSSSSPAKPDRPVVMVVQATITDPVRYGRYMEALVASGLFQSLGATPLLTGPVFETLEGEPAAGAIVAVVQFPSQAKAHAFWHGEAYRKIAKLREGAGDFRVGLWKQLPPMPPPAA